MGGRGGSAVGWKSDLRKMAKQGRIPSYIFGNKDQQAEAFREINKLYSLPPDLRQFMSERYANGVKKVETIGSDSSAVRIRFEDKTLVTSVPSSGEDVRKGVEKFLLLNEWKKRKSK